MFFFFLVDRVSVFKDKLLRGDIWSRTCSALCRFIAVLKSEPLRISDAGLQERLGLVETGTRVCFALVLLLAVFHAALATKLTGMFA